LRFFNVPDFIKAWEHECFPETLLLYIHMSVVFTANYFLVVDDVSIDNEMFLMIDFVNLKNKSAQFFRVTHRGRVVCVFIGLSTHTYISIYLCTMFLRKKKKFQKEKPSEKGEIRF
jgi:hypothetical protein